MEYLGGRIVLYHICCNTLIHYHEKRSQISRHFWMPGFYTRTFVEACEFSECSP